MRSLVAVAAAVALTTSACGGGSNHSRSSQATFEATGTVDVLGASDVEVLTADRATTGDRCQGVGPLRNVTGGSEVLVLNASGDKVAVGELSEGTLPETAQTLGQIGFTPCEFTFSVPDVPASDGLYTLQVGDSETSFKQSDAKTLKVSITTR